MNIIELNLMRTEIIRMICDESNEQILIKIEDLLLSKKEILPKNVPCRYSTEELKRRVRSATESIRSGNGYTLEEMKSLHSENV